MDTLERYKVSLVTGFLPESPPLDRLPSYFDPWENLACQVPQLLKEKRFREEVEGNLPLLIVSDNHLPSEPHWNRASAVVTYLSQAYLWQEGEAGAVSILPKQLAIPWWEVSHKLGVPPVASYGPVVLWNWKLKDPSKPVVLDNLSSDLLYTGTGDEEWFYLVSAATELSAAPGIVQASRCLEMVEEGNDPEIIKCLEAVAVCIRDMLTVLDEMYSKNNPDIFYNKVRPYLAGTKNMKVFSKGLIYEGVSTEPMAFGGPSAGQSSTLQVFDILLGVEHKGIAKEFLDLQKWHMPRPHRQFLLALSSKTSLRKYILSNKSNELLIQRYDECVQALTDFRSKHVIMVTRFIVTPARRSGHGNKEDGTLATRGTGGSDFMVLLKSSRDETQNCLIK